MKRPGSNNRYPLPGDPGRLTRLFWALEDWWRSLDPIDRHSILIMLAGILLCLWLRFLP